MSKKNKNKQNSLMGSLEIIKDDKDDKQKASPNTNKSNKEKESVPVKKVEPVKEEKPKVAAKEIKSKAVEQKVNNSANKVEPKKETKKVKETISTKKTKKKHNYILWTGMVVILIPCLLLLYILLGSRENSGEPINGSRFDGTLDPAITETQTAELKDELMLEGVESIEVTLKSASLRVNMNMSDDASEESMLAALNAAYDLVVAKLPVDTYFTNKTEGESVKKMYDLQVTVYNFIPKPDEDKSSQIQIIRTKNAAAESDVTDVVTSPKNEETADEILNPDTSTIPNSEAEEETE